MNLLFCGGEDSGIESLVYIINERARARENVREMTMMSLHGRRRKGTCRSDGGVQNEAAFAPKSSRNDAEFWKNVGKTAENDHFLR